MKQNLLIVDDRPENLFVLESTLENPEYSFIRAESGEEALKQLLHHDISIILLDVQMPGMDGFETAELIRGNPLTKNIPIIFVSAINQEKKHIFKGYAAGAIDYIFKPFDPEILRSKVHILLDLDRQRRIVQQQNDALSFAKRNTDSILKNVKEGLFLTNRDYSILPQYSKALEQILDLKDLATKNLLDILKPSIEEKTYKDLSQFLSLSFDPAIDSESILDLNPLTEFVYHPETEKAPKYLSIDCRRIYNNDTIENLIFTVNDNTSKVLLENKLARAEEEAGKQMDNLFSIIHVDPLLLKDFIESLEKDIAESEKGLAQLTNSKNKTEILEGIYRSIHQIKGNAAVLDLKNFMLQAHNAEDIINTLLESDTVSKKDIALLDECLIALQKRVEEIKLIISKLNHIYKYFRPKRSYEIDLLFKAINNLMGNLQKTTGKKVKLECSNFDSSIIPYNSSLSIKDILVQFIRNSYYHGIESAQERSRAGKKPDGTITIETIRKNNTAILIYKDDGRGIQLDKLKNVASKSGRWDDQEIKQWDENQLMESIYSSGISTMQKVNSGAGRGVGMDIVKEMIDRAGGTIEIQTEKGEYTLFRISLPLKVAEPHPLFAEENLN